MAPTYSLPSFPSPPRTTQHVKQGANRSLVSLLLLALFLGACVGYVPIYLLYRCWEARRLKNSGNASEMETWTAVHSFGMLPPPKRERETDANISGSRHPDNKDNHSNIEVSRAFLPFRGPLPFPLDHLRRAFRNAYHTI